MKSRAGVLLFMSIIYLTPLPFALAEQRLSGEMRQLLEQSALKKNKKNFAGWKGILFYCYFNDDSTQVEKDICEKADVNAEFLAATAKIDLIKTHNSFDAVVLAKEQKRLVLELDLHSTTHESPAAVSARVLAYIEYSNAVEDSPWKNEKDNVRAFPRSGKLIVWEESVVGASTGTSEALVDPVSKGVEQYLKKFFMDYLKAQR